MLFIFTSISLLLMYTLLFLFKLVMGTILLLFFEHALYMFFEIIFFFKRKLWGPLSAIRWGLYMFYYMFDGL